MPPPPIVELLSKLLSFVQLGGLVLVVAGSNAFRLLGFSTVPSWYGTIEKNGIQVAILVYLILPQVLARYIVSGAFEIELDGRLIFSKLETGRMPQYADLINPLLSAGLQMANKEG